MHHLYRTLSHPLPFPPLHHTSLLSPSFFFSQTLTFFLHGNRTPWKTDLQARSGGARQGAAGRGEVRLGAAGRGEVRLGATRLGGARRGAVGSAARTRGRRWSQKRADEVFFFQNQKQVSGSAARTKEGGRIRICGGESFFCLLHGRLGVRRGRTKFFFVAVIASVVATTIRLPPAEPGTMAKRKLWWRWKERERRRRQGVCGGEGGME
ncbi:unnamed protein product [Linum trigynum]|uniref:Uncharacterized protein n=1 Tax=Linum trigynum TaxID=586398 RepID=A0AAV2CTW4_9ROSI